MRLLFLRATGLGDQSVEPDQIAEVSDLVRVREFLASGRAKPAPDETAPAVPTEITSDALAPDPKPATQRRNP